MNIWFNYLNFMNLNGCFFYKNCLRMSTEGEIVIYHKLQKRLRKIENRLKKIKQSIDSLPPGKLIFSKNGKYTKWYHRNGEDKLYIKKSEHTLAEKLAMKKYLQLLEKDLINEKKAISLYLNKIDSHKEKAENLLLDNSEYRSLLNSYLIPHSKELENWMKEPYEKNPYYPEKLIHKCMSGNIVRSKSEALIDMILYTNRIPYRYDCELKCGNKSYYPDFTIRHPKTGEVFYWEHFGMIDREIYREDMLSKLRSYIMFGIIPSKNLIMTFETGEEPFTSEKAELIVEHYFL